MKPEEAIEIVVKVVGELEGKDPKGARWDHLVEKLTERGLSRGEIDDAVMEALDTGFLYEPQIGRIQIAKTPAKEGLFNW